MFQFKVQQRERKKRNLIKDKFQNFQITRQLKTLTNTNTDELVVSHILIYTFVYQVIQDLYLTQ